MTWNNRIIITSHEYDVDYTEYTASIHEAYYNKDDPTETPAITEFAIVSGSGDTPEEALEDLHLHLSLLLESVIFVETKQTAILDLSNPTTFDAGAKSNVSRLYNEKSSPTVLDKDDDYLDEKYGDDDE